MALQVWLPLNGNLDNKGLANVSVTNSGASVNSAGKIGSCYSFANNNYFEITNLPFSKLTNCSIAFWFYLNSNEDWLPCTGQSTSYYFMATSGNTGTFYHNNVGSNTITIYRNGVAGTTPIAAGSWVHYTITGLNLSSWTRLLINQYGYTGSGWNFTGKMNDFRIYDHCLSPKEVKEISKGLVLHYKLDDPYIEATANLFTGVNRVNEKMTKVDNGVDVSTTSGDAYCSLGLSTTLTAGSTYTLSFDVSGMGASDVCYFGFYYNNQMNYVTQIHNGRCSIVITSAPAVSSLTFDDSARTNANIIHIRNFQLEAKDHVTPYTPSSRAQGMAYDCSGYERNGTITGSLSTETSSPRYLKAAKGNAAIAHTLFSMNKPITVCYWVYLTTNGQTGSGTINTTGNVSFYRDHDGVDKYTFSIQRTDTTTAYCTVWAPVTQGWHHLAYVCDSNSFKVYKDGVVSSYSYDVKDAWTTISLMQSNNVGLSDFRIYATALSADDIKDLYQTSASIHNTGTIDAFEFEENTNSIVNKTGIVESETIIENNDYLYTLSDGSVWFKLLHHNNPASNLFTASNCWDYNDGSNLYSKLGWLKTGVWTSSSGEYEFLIREKLTSSSSENQFRWKQTSNPSTSSTITGYSVISGSPSYAGGLKTNGSYGAMHNGNTWWCCCGSYTAYQGGIPGFFGIVTTGYLDLYVRIVGPNASGIDNTARVYSNTISSNQIIEI